MEYHGAYDNKQNKKNIMRNVALYFCNRDLFLCKQTNWNWAKILI